MGQHQPWQGRQFRRRAKGITLPDTKGGSGGGPSDARSRWNERYRTRSEERDVVTPPSAASRLFRAVEVPDRAVGMPDRAVDMPDRAIGMPDRAVGMPDRGLAVDLAGGDGSTALWFAEQGFQPVLVEVSDVAINLATARATATGVDLLCLQQDLEQSTLASVLRDIEAQLHRDLNQMTSDNPGSIAGPEVGIVSCFHYLNRELLASVSAGLPPGAVLMASIATVRNLERHEKPSARFLLEPRELEDLILGGQDDPPVGTLSILHSFEGWNSAGNHEAEIIVRRSRHSRD